MEPLSELAREGPPQAAAVIDLVEHALARVEHAMEQIDDSDGEIGSLLAELQDLHFAACKLARPDPVKLAERLYQWEVDGNWDVFYGAAEKYAEILGPAGLAAYHERAEAAWKFLPALQPGEREDYSGRRFRLTSILESLARTRGDLDAIVAIKSKDLSHAWNFLQIAELYLQAGQPDAALAWAERGLKAFPQKTDIRLLEFIAREYHRRRRHDDALALMWRPFEAHPSLEHYRLLKTHAARNQSWPAWRDRALAHLRSKLPPKDNAPRTFLAAALAQSHHETLVRIFLWEKNAAAAWQESQAGPCGRELSLELAATREAAHPADVIPIYLHEAESLIGQTGNRSYEAAVRHLKKIKALYLRLDQESEWTALLLRLRTTHKSKRNFITMAAKL